MDNKGYNMQVVGTQPGAVPGMEQQRAWMTLPEGGPQVSGCPPGLEYLAYVDQLLIKQEVSLLEAFTGWEVKNKYAILNSMGQQIFYAVEESGICMRQCCGSQRGFVLHITDNRGQEVLRLRREFKCCAGCCWCACADCIAHEIAVEAPPGNPIGYIRQQQSFWKPNYSMADSGGDIFAWIKGPCCVCSCVCCCPDVNFQVTGKDESTQIGTLVKQWSGAVRELFTNADFYSISFPMDMDVGAKATMLGAVFLMDFVFFEKNNNDNNHGGNH